MTRETFTCDNCHGTYKKIWSDEEALKEHAELYPEAVDDPLSVLCDDCNEKFKIWFAGLTEEQKKKMRDDYYNELR